MKLALWQTAGFPADTVANLGALETTARAAATAGASLLLCPECWLCGYNIGAAVATLAEQRDGISSQVIAGIARRNNIAIAYGYAERDVSGGEIYNAAQVIGPDGGRLAHYRKTHLFGPDERAAYRPGECLADIDGKAIAAAGAGDALIIGEISQARRLAAAKCFPYRADRRPELYAQLTSNFDGRC